MKLVYAASEILPFASTGGLAELGSALCRTLAKRNVQVSRIMPLYRQVAESAIPLQDTGVRLDIPVGFRVYQAEVWKAQEPAPQTFFIRRDEFFDRSQLYSLPNRDYDDNFERFVFFQKAVVALIDSFGLQPDIVHCCDWQTGLVPMFLKHGIGGAGRHAREKVVLTIHNLSYQGIYPGSLYSLTNLPFFCFNMETMEFYGNINCLKGGIAASDATTTVSRTYAQEIRTEELGCGLHGLLAQMGERLVGIINGADYDAWDPSNDQYLAKPFSKADLGGKRACKADLIASMGLKIGPDTPILGVVSRLVDHKGMDILAEAMPALMSRNIAFVILGTGREQYQALVRDWMTRWPGRFAAKLAFELPLGHKVIAGADIYVMPSRFEPSGHSQLCSLRYGTIPVVHATGGLEDTVQDISPDASSGTGFKFKAYTADALLAAVDRALALQAKPDAWKHAMLRAMDADFSWAKTADEYQNLYHKLLS